MNRLAGTSGVGRATGVMRAGVILAILALLAASAALGARPNGRSTTSAFTSAATSSASPFTSFTEAGGDWFTFDYMVDAGYFVPVEAPGYDTLVATAPNGKGYIPYLAKSWKQTPTSITFHLEHTAKCLDGHVINSLDVVKTLVRWVQVPKRSGGVASSAWGGWGLGPYHVHASGKWTVTVSLGTPYGPLMQFFSDFGILCPSAWPALAANPKALETAIYGSGPYQLVSAAHGQQIVWKLRPNWNWGPPGTSAKTMPQNFTYKIVTDPTTVANLLLTGGVDEAGVQGPDVARLAASSDIVKGGTPNWLPYTLWFNMHQGKPTTDLKLRQAIATAVSPQEWNASALGGSGHVATSMIRPDGACFDPKTKSLVPKTSISEALNILKSDGYTLTGGQLMKNGQQLSLSVLTITSQGSGPDYLVSVLSQLGIKADLQNLATAAYSSALLNGNFDVAPVVGRVPDPSPGASFSFVSAGENPAGIGAGYPAWETDIKNGLQSVGKTACSWFDKAQELALKNYFYLPLDYVDFPLFWRKGISFNGYNSNLYFVHKTS
jgi:peptide/nickel transport system substrate-binding protein